MEENSYELCYNMACYLIGKEDYQGAEKKLKQAEGERNIISPSLCRIYYLLNIHVIYLLEFLKNFIIFIKFYFYDNSLLQGKL